MSLPDSARNARDAAAALGATFEDLDGGRGYLYRVSKGGRSFLGGAGAVSAFPVNSATAVSIARDKAHTKSVLRSIGLPVIDGGLFFAHQRRASLREPGREIADALAYASALGFPVFCKPNAGAHGNLAEIIHSAAELLSYAQRLALEFESFLVEPLVSGTEHRILVQNGRAVFHVVKASPYLLGDGVSTLAQLLDAANTGLAGTGVSPTPALALPDPHAIPSPGARTEIPGRRNLSSDGDIAHFSTEPPDRLGNLAIAATDAIGLRIAGIDIFDLSPDRNLSDLVVLEVNGNPGLKSAELAGRRDIALSVWTSMFTELMEA
jgi:cyanophycin synthetase